MIDGSAFDRRLDPATDRPLAVAFSGGGDSLAVLRLSLAWARAHGRRVLALTVDHGLHPESAMWTAAAGAVADRLGADWRGLVWTGPKPSSGVQARARDARHRLLAEAAGAEGARVLVLGHTADDAAETEWMRRTSALGIGRLREWSPSPVWPEGRGLFLLRPLLTVRRSALRDWLRARGDTWFEDPANRDSRFARIRARGELAGQDLPPHSSAESDLTAVAAQVAWTDHEARLPYAAIIDAPDAPRQVVTGILATCLGAAATPPRTRERARLVDAIIARRIVTLAGCRIDARGDPVRFARAAPRAGRPPVSEPIAWARLRFDSACGLYPDEARLP